MRPARSGSSRYAILGLLSLGPMSGYDLRKAAASSIGHFWNESYGQIYPALRKLAEEGRVRLRRTGGHTRADRQEYEITEAGRQELRRWRAAPPRPQPPRDELLLKLFFGETASVPDHLDHVRRLRAAAAERLRRYRGLRRRILRTWRRHPGHPFWLMTLGHGLRHSEATLRWCDETLAALERQRAGGRAPGRTSAR